MILQQWRVILAVECVFICVSELSLQKRQCAFQLNGTTNIQQIYKFMTAGNVSGSVQVCENTQCCVGYYQIISGQPEVDILACAVVKKSCPDSTCEAKTLLHGRGISCVCNTDFCNSNITWTPHSEQLQVTYSYSKGELITFSVIILTGTLLIVCFMITAAKWRRLFADKKENVQAHLLCSCQITKTSKIDIDDIELQQIVGRGDFATVLQGKYQGSTVAVKVFPADWKHKFTAEKEVYELPLMKHAGILHFLGTGRKPEGSCFIVSQFAEHGSLHSFLCEHTTSWTLSLKLCQSLSQGLSYLHSDLRRYDVHKPPVAHGDLTSSNVLVRADGTCVLCDFGCSTILRSCSGRHSWQSNMIVMKSGTLRYMSPEFLEGCANISSSCCLMQGDVYALGLLLWEIWMRCSDLFAGIITPQHLLPYESELRGNVTLESLISYVSNLDKRPPIPKHWELLPQGSALQELLTDCWDCDPDARLTAQCAADRLVSLQSCFS